MAANSLGDLRKQALDVFEKAKTFDNNGQLQEAIDTYLEAVRIMTLAKDFCRVAHDEAQMFIMVNNWLDRCDYLNKVLTQRAKESAVQRHAQSQLAKHGAGDSIISEIRARVAEMIVPVPPRPRVGMRGVDKARELLISHVISPFQHAEFLKSFKRTAGVLLIGVPGTGKTSLINEVVSLTSGVTYMVVKASQIRDKFVGVSEKVIEELFKTARAKAPTVLFIDEVEAILPNRNDDSAQHQNSATVTFLTEMNQEYYDPKKFVVVVGATNHPQMIDFAARRRLGNRVLVPMPNTEVREQIIKDLLPDGSGKASHALTDENIKDIANRTHRFTGHDLNTLIIDAALLPMNRTAQAKRFIFDESIKMYRVGHCDACEESDEPCPSCMSVRASFETLTADKVIYEPITYEDIVSKLNSMTPSVTDKEISQLEAYLDPDR